MCVLSLTQVTVHEFHVDIPFIRMQVLDDLGDRSEPAVRQQYFNEIDKDGSGAIDFEEFLAVRLKL